MLAQQIASPVLVELFTCQFCSSCPPADALLAGSDPAILALDMHVTYWNGPAWRDRFSFSAATERQRAYARLFGLDSICTPQLVAGGRFQAVGSDTSAVHAAIAAAGADATPGPTLRLAAHGTALHLDLGAGTGAGRLFLVGFDPAHGGENAGRVLREVDIVRSLAVVGAWTGAPLRLDLPAPSGRRAAAFLQAPDGRISAVAVLP
ncbi:MAG TPA: DUF1223 domain-containing protein [Acetobacteraceae bacterium]|nr:DUF1223 domain-containing protein [Acetobacteraceae bacterium]